MSHSLTSPPSQPVSHGSGLVDDEMESCDRELLQSLVSGDAHAVRQSIERGADVNRRCTDRLLSTPLHVAAAQPSPSCLIELLQAPQKPTCERNADGETPLFVACRCSRSISTPLLLLSTFGVPTTANNRGETFLHILVRNEEMLPSQMLQLMQWILSETNAASLLNVINARGKTVYDVAREYRSDDHELLQLLVQNGAASTHIQQLGQHFTLTQTESTQRADIERSEHDARHLLHVQRTHTITAQRNFEETLVKLEHTESVKRATLIEKEDNRRSHETRKCATQLESLRKKARQRRRGAAAVIQAAGRGYAARMDLSRTRHTAELDRRKLAEVQASSSVVLLQRVGRGALCREQVSRAVLPTVLTAPIPARSSSADSLTTETTVTTPERRHTKVYLPDTNTSAQPGPVEHDGMDHPACVGVDAINSPPSSTLLTVQFADPSPTTISAPGGLPSVDHPIGLITTTTTTTATDISAKEGETVPRFPSSSSQSSSPEETPHLWSPEQHSMGVFSEEDAACQIQNWWRRCQYQHQAVAVAAIEQVLSLSALRVNLFNYCLERRIKIRIETITSLVTSLVWRENFCSEFRRITREKRHARQALASATTTDPAAPRPWYIRWKEMTAAYHCWTLLVQMAISLFLLIYMGCAPRSGPDNVHNKVDIAFCVVQLVILFGLPWSRWMIVDAAVIITALVCAACRAYGGTIVITLLLLKAPLLASCFFPHHSATNTYCRALRYCGLYLLMMFPLGLACVGSTVRGTSIGALMLTSGGNWGRVLLVLWSTLSPQYVVRTMVQRDKLPSNVANATTFQQAPFYGAKAGTKTVLIDDVWALQISRLPTVQLLICNVGLIVFSYSAIIVGTNNAIREHYDLSDETKLKRNKRRFQYKHYKQKMELLDAHRAVTIEALGQQLDGLMWEDDIRAAKEAIRESHRIQFQSTVTTATTATTTTSAGGGVALPKGRAISATTQRHGTVWDCRNEDPQCRGTLDIVAIETALGKAERTGRRERFFIRQWKGNVFRRESTLVVVVFVIMSSIQPNLYPMEAAFSAVYTVELLLSLYFLRVEFIFSHPWRLLIRLFCVVIGFVPSGNPFVVLRGLRLLEGWSTLFDIPGMVKWGFMYCLITLCTIWMVSFVASLQFAAAARAGTPGAASYCGGTANCLALSLRELVLPAWTPLRIDPVREPPLTCLLIIAFQFLFIPFMLSFMLHPLLQLSNFIGRFLRLVVRSLHKDVLGFLGNYVEGEEWFRRWALAVSIPTNVIVKLKLWVHDIQRPPIGFSPFAVPNSAALTHERSFFFRNETMVMPLSSSGDSEDDAVVDRAADCDPPEIVSKSHFASLAENAAQRDFERRAKGEPVPLQQQTSTSKSVVVAARPSWQAKLESLARQIWLHVLNAVLTAVSFAFLWVADASCHPRDAVAIVASVFHVASIVTNLLVIPRDLTALLTAISSASLIVSVVMIHVGIPGLRPIYAVRFLSLLRLAQIQVYPFRAARRFLGDYLASWSKIVFPFLLIGGLSYAAELLRAQIYMVQHPTYADTNSTNTTRPRTASNWESPASVAAAQYSSGDTATSSSSYPEWLASFPRTHHSRPNVNATRSLFSYYFKEDAFIFFSIYTFWLLPALAISTCLSFLYWSGSNLRDTDRSVIFLIPFLEDPMTLANFRFSQSYFHYFANAILLLSVTFGCIFSPTTQAVAKRDHSFFFGFEVGFTCIGLIDALLSVAFAVFRSRRTWAGRSIGRQDFRYVNVLVGDTALVLAEVIQLLYYCVALPIAVAMLVDTDNLLLSPDNYALYFITVRFALLLRLLPRQCLLTFIQAFPTVVFACAAIAIYYVASASALADTAGAASGGLTPATWRVAFNDVIRESLTFAVPCTFHSEWTTDNDTALAQEMLATSTYTYTTGNCHDASYMVFILATIGKAVIASAVGLGAAILLVPLRTPLVAPLPPKSAHLYRTLSGGINAIVDEGEALHDDMRPEARRRLQRRKFTRMFTARGIPSWGLRHLLEELNIARPSRQRRFMFLLEQLLIYLPISDLRQEQVHEYMSMWSCYCTGGPADVSFKELAAYPPRNDMITKRRRRRDSTKDWDSDHGVNPLQDHGVVHLHTQTASPPSAQVRYIAPLRLVQALALFELNFPADSSIGSQLLMDFFTVVQKVRGATLMQSLWRMYCCEKAFEADASRSKLEQVKLTYLRRQFRKLRMKNDAGFRRLPSVSGEPRSVSFAVALANEPGVYNLDTGHYDLLNRIRGHYHDLTADEEDDTRESSGENGDN